MNTKAKSEQIQWFNGQTNVSDTVEKICPARHIGKKQWQSELNKMYHARWKNEYVSDYEYPSVLTHPIDANRTKKDGWQNLQMAKLQGTKVSITHLASSQLTTEKGMETIVNSVGFRGGMKKAKFSFSVLL